MITNTCPNCGYCPHCGRVNTPRWPRYGYPYVQPQPFQPYMYGKTPHVNTIKVWN